MSFLLLKTWSYSDYYLIVWDFITQRQWNHRWSWKRIGAGVWLHIVLALNIDSLKYNLAFEFLNPERISMPDFVLISATQGARESLTMSCQIWRGQGYWIITFGTMAARGSVRDVGRFGYTLCRGGCDSKTDSIAPE